MVAPLLWGEKRLYVIYGVFFKSELIFFFSTGIHLKIENGYCRGWCRIYIRSYLRFSWVSTTTDYNTRIFGLTFCYSLLGALLKKLAFTRALLMTMSLALGLQIAGGILTLITYYRHKGAECVFKDSTVGNVNICDAWNKMPQAVIIVLCIVPVLIQACE